MPKVTLKMHIFSSISLESPEICVETLRVGPIFPKMFDLRYHMPRFTLKMNIFPSISLETP